MIILVLIAVLTVVSAGTLYLVLQAINPNPETNPTFPEALAYCLINSVLGRLPFGGALSIAFWVWLFNQKFYLNTVALIICTVIQSAVVYGVALVLVKALT